MTTLASASVLAPSPFVLLDCDAVVRLWPMSQAYIRSTAQIRPTPYLLHRVSFAFATCKATQDIIRCFSLMEDTPKLLVGLRPLSGYKQICLIYFTLIRMISLLHDLGLRPALKKHGDFDSMRCLICHNLPGTHQAFYFSPGYGVLQSNPTTGLQSFRRGQPFSTYRSLQKFPCA